MIVAIDGPAGAGKSSVAKQVASRLGFSYLDTGAMYRAVTHEVLRRGIAPDDATAIAAMMGALDLDVRDGDVVLGGRSVAAAIRSQAVTDNVSEVAAHPVVRAALVPLQREAASRGDTIVEGRDIGSAVFPDADVKVFLTASTDERARRRALQLDRGMSPSDVSRIERELQRRDRADASRSASPLVQPEDAHVLDTTALSFEQVVEAIVRLIDSAR